MFVANLRPEWEDLGTFRAAMEGEGDVIRCFIMCNPQGASKARFSGLTPTPPLGHSCIGLSPRNPCCVGRMQDCCCVAGGLTGTVSLTTCLEARLLLELCC